LDNKSSTALIVIADDDEDDCLLVKSAFGEMESSYDLRFVGDGRELLDYLRNKGIFSDVEKSPRPSLILLDLNMPRIDGREALALIKSDLDLKQIPVLILTTSREKKDIDYTREYGASSFLVKPDLFQDLTDMLSKFCAAILDNEHIPFEVTGL
jgi:CheY-like chemotaxis protein